MIQDKVELLIVHNDLLYAVTRNEVTGTEVWYSADGSSWQQANNDGWEDSPLVQRLSRVQ